MQYEINPGQNKKKNILSGCRKFTEIHKRYKNIQNIHPYKYGWVVHVVNVQCSKRCAENMQIMLSLTV